jgi:hypothetical protein
MRTIRRTDAATGQPVAPLILNDTLAIGDTFRLIGNTTAFRAVALPLVASFIPSVVGVSQCGRYRTTARIRDTAQA